MKNCDEFLETLWTPPSETTASVSRSELDAHLEFCPDCRRERELVKILREGLLPSAGEERALAMPQPGAEAEASPLPWPPAPEVLTLEELAAHLRVPLEALREDIADLPAFEIGGHLRFRRKTVDRWLAQRERGWRRQMTIGRVREAAWRRR